MGFTVYYQSVDSLDRQTRDAIDATNDELCGGRSWLSCEPVHFFSDDQDGRLLGGSKPNFMPHPDDVAAAESGWPDGTIQDALNVLCQLSRDHGVDWEISHDHSDGPIGLIRNGQADLEVQQQVSELAGLGGVLGEYEGDGSSRPAPDSEDRGPGLRLFRPDDD